MIVNNRKKAEKIFFISNQKGMALITVLIFVFVLVSFSVALLIITKKRSNEMDSLDIYPLIHDDPAG